MATASGALPCTIGKTAGSGSLEASGFATAILPGEVLHQDEIAGGLALGHDEDEELRAGGSAAGALGEDDPDLDQSLARLVHTQEISPEVQHFLF